MPRVSVVVPAYNSADTLGRAIDSVLAQTLSDLELVVVDDASGDDTESVVTGYDDPRVQYVAHERNRGGSAARNTGIDRADGDYVAFLDADDEWRRPKLERQVDALESRSDEWIAAHCDRVYERDPVGELGYRLARLVGTQKADPPKEGGQELIREVFMRNLSSGASTLLVAADALEEIGGWNAEFPRHQDWEFVIRLLQHGKLAYVDEPLVVKHRSGRPGADLYVESKELLLSEFADEVDRLESEGYPVTHKQHLHMAKIHFEDGQFGRGRERFSTLNPDLSEYLSLGWSAALGLRTRLG